MESRDQEQRTGHRSVAGAVSVAGAISHVGNAVEARS